MRDRKAAARYARAVFQEALSHDRLDEAAEDLALLGKVWSESPELVAFLSHPLVTPEKKREVCRVLLGSWIRSTQLQLLELLVERKRVALLPEIAPLFEEMVDDHRGIVRAEVHSAVPLTEDEQARLSRALAALFGGTPILTLQVRPELIGGVAVRVKDAVLDGSVRTSLNVLAADLRAVSVDVSAMEQTCS